MSGIGQVLGDARRGLGIPLDRAAADTGLRETYLSALERDEVDELGLDPAYVRGALRTYAVYLGLDPYALVARYQDTRPDGVRVSAPTRGAARTLAAALTLVVVAVGAFLLGDAMARGSLPAFLDDRTATEPEPAGAAERSEPAGPVAADEPSEAATGDDEESVLAEPGTEALELRLLFTDESWVRVTADGDTLLEGIYPRGAVEAFDASDEIDVRVGVTDAIEFTFNGAWYGALAQRRPGPVDVRCDVADGCRVVD